MSIPCIDIKSSIVYLAIKTIVKSIVTESGETQNRSSEESQFFC